MFRRAFSLSSFSGPFCAFREAHNEIRRVADPIATKYRVRGELAGSIVVPIPRAVVPGHV
jgi:hypothetical protein